MGVHFFHIMSILNIKTCSFHFRFPSVVMPAKKRNPAALFSASPLKMLFVLHSFKNTSVCTNSYEKNRNDSSEEKQKIKYEIRIKEHQHAQFET